MTSILICELDNGTVQLFVNGAHVLENDEQKTRIESIANSKATTDGVVESLALMATKLKEINTIDS